MTEQQTRALAYETASLSVFRGLLELSPMAAFLDFLRCTGDPVEKMYRYGKFVYSLTDYGCSFSAFLTKAVCEDENLYVRLAAKNRPVPEAAEINVQAELALFSRLTELTPEELCAGIDGAEHVPAFCNTKTDFSALYADRLARIHQVGYGIFASAAMFRLEDNGDIVPVEAADSTTREKFIGYEAERQQVYDNTRALVDGRPAANVLLCGDAGTGKSSTVKACANDFYAEGIRLIEIRKDQLFRLSRVMGRIADNPLKFILFIDDLSFNKNDDCFSMLKAVLEGSASAKAGNAVIYATSNRRHIVKESFSDRESSDDVHHSDTVQELMSLSDRFGLTVYFGKPDKKLYLEIVRTLADRAGVTMEQDELFRKAEAFALGRGSRSPRTAEQFITGIL
ncbi:MAG: ATP-binding protein [Clostridia bacterium]|nr:ATP-binding protein [Clostridia bacterium]